MPLIRVWALRVWIAGFTILVVVALVENRSQTTDVRTLAEQNRVLIEDGLEAHGAICALRADLERRVASSKKFLADLDAGRRPPIRGITRADIKNGIDNQQRTIDALGDIEC